MGCISSKLAVSDGGEEKRTRILCTFVGDCPNHVVSLTSTTYGALKLDREVEHDVPVAEEPPNRCRSPTPTPFRKSVSKEEAPEVINAWELMRGLDDESPVKKVVKPEDTPVTRQTKQSLEARYVGKENREEGPGLLVPEPARLGKPSPRGKPLGSIENAQRVRSPASAVRYRSSTPMDLKIQITRRGTGLSPVPRRRSLGHLFDPDLGAAFENDVSRSQEREKMRTMGGAGTPRQRKAAILLESFEKKCPPGGERAVVLYTTTLRGIRKTFEDCNATRSAIESCGVQVVERDTSMDSGYREELRRLMGKKEARVPALFVKGRWIGGADDVLKLEEEGKLEALFDGVPRGVAWCDGCGGMRFVMCVDCNGSCKLLDEKQQKVVKCGECNENGLIRCPLCR